MTIERFKRFIINILNNENIFTPPAAAFYNFHDLGENWCKDWTAIFKKILNDIKAGKNYETDNDNQAGNCVVKPLANRIEWLAVYFSLQKGKYTIYMIKLETPDDVFHKDFHSVTPV
jgi:hypothetical protein